MDYLSLAAVLLFTLFLFLGGGVWVGLSLMGVSWLLMTLFVDSSAGASLMTVVWSTSTNWSLTALPLFIWMGEILYRTKLSENLFKAISPWVSRIPGGLLHVNVMGCTLFAAVSGSSAATLTTVGKMVIPELAERKYDEKKVIGTLAGAATLGLMIPPSLTLIVYGVTVNQSISKLFLAGIIPGLVLAGLFMGYIVISALIKPDENIIQEPRISLKEKLARSRFLIPLIALMTAIIGSIYTGFATATEAAALGVVGALLLSVLQRCFTWHSFWQSVVGATQTTAMIALILMGSSFLSMTMGYTGLPYALAEWVATFELTTFTLIFSLTIFYIIIGMFLDGISAIVLTMAVVEPMIRAAGIDMIWFGIFIVVLVEMAQITPPIGFNLFVMQKITNKELDFIARAAFPMFLIMVVMVILLALIPEMAVWLPGVLY